METSGRCVPSDSLACGPGTVREGDLCVVFVPPPPPLPSGVFAVQGTSVELDPSDLAPLDAMISSAQVVALGESVHTSGGYYEAKDRLFRYLVQEHGFRVYAFESPWEDAELVANYVQSCIQGQPSDTARNVIVRGLFGVWASEETMQLVEWMCSYNQENPNDPVSFFGFDIQQPWQDGPALFDFLRQAAPMDAEPLITQVSICNGATSGSQAAYYQDFETNRQVSVEDNLACEMALSATEQYFTDNEAALIAATSADELEWARIRLVGLRSWQGQIFLFEQDPPASLEARDEGMAYAFERIGALRYPGQRMVIWAHNTHIAQQQNLIEGYYSGGKSMGTFLKETLMDDYVAVGLIGYEVSIEWPGVGQGPIPPTNNGSSAEVLLHNLEQPFLLVDLQDNALFEQGQSYELGQERMVPQEQFRAMLFLDRSPPMRPLNW